MTTMVDVLACLEQHDDIIQAKIDAGDKFCFALLIRFKLWDAGMNLAPEKQIAQRGLISMIRRYCERNNLPWPPPVYEDQSNG